MTTSAHFECCFQDAAAPQTLKSAVALVLSTMDKHIAGIERSVQQLEFLRPFAREQSSPPSDPPHVGAINAARFCATRNELYQKCFNSGVKALDAARRALVPHLESRNTETALRVSSELENWNFQGLDLIRPPHIDETDLYVADREALSKWRIEADAVRSSLRAIVSLEDRSPLVKARWITVTELADQFGVARNALRKRLARARRKYPDIFKEIENTGPREERYMYLIDAVAPIAESLRNKRPAKRPARESSTSK